MSMIGADALLVVHFAWAIWMIGGIVLAVAGLAWRRLWRWRWFRITHLIGLLVTATVPLWANGICPLTTWEWALRARTAETSRSFLIYWIDKLLYVDVSPVVLSFVTGLGAVVTLVIFVWRPPWGANRQEKQGR